MRYALNQVRQHPKTINRAFAAKLTVANIAFTAEATKNVDAALVAQALTARASNGGDLPKQAANGNYGYDGEGIRYGVIVDIYDNDTGYKIAASTPTGDREVYGRLSDVAGVATLKLFHLDATGAEVAYNHTGTVMFDFDYVHRFEDLPLDFATAITSKRVQQDTGGDSVPTEVQEVLTVVSKNVLPKFSGKPVTGSVVLSVGGHNLYESNLDFTVVESIDFVDPLIKYYVINSAVDPLTDVQNGQWNPAVAGYNLDVGDVVVATYKMA